MKTSRRRLLPLALSMLLAASRLHAQDLTPPVLAKPISDFTVAVGTASSTMKLKKTFALTGVGSGPFVRFSTSQGNIDVQMRPDAAPQTVANFLNYVNRGAYDGSFIHRSVPGFIVQGGGFRFVNNSVEDVPADPPVVTALLKLAVSANSNPGLVTATLSGQNLLLAYTPGVTGAATITVQAKDNARAKARATFTVTVQ